MEIRLHGQRQTQDDRADYQSQKGRRTVPDIILAIVETAAPAFVGKSCQIGKERLLPAMGTKAKKGSGKYIRLPFYISVWFNAIA